MNMPSKVTGQSARPDDPEILLVSLPWTNIIEPNLGLALLKAILRDHDVPARVLHLNVFALEFLRASSYEALSVVYALNDFLFSHTLDPHVTAAQMRSLRLKVEDLRATGAFGSRDAVDADEMIERLLDLRETVVPAWLAKWADEIAASPATLIGFTCMFDQTIASLALAKLIRARAPHKRLVMGGYAVRNPTGAMIMGIYDWIDAICTGEGEATILDLARHNRGEIGLEDVRGILRRTSQGEIVSTPAPPQADLDANPDPDYDDFFADTARMAADHHVDLRPASLPIENARGCWWGATRQCIFCGIDKADLAYRHRSAERVLSSLRHLRARYGMKTFRFSDYIMPQSFYRSLLPALAQEEPGFVLSTEMKANVKEEQFAMLAQAGFFEVQPGIESFSSPVLRRMDKGVSAIQNVYCLKLGRKYGVRILYNILWGFPDDAVEEYRETAQLLPKLRHFDPPVSCVPVQVTRYAPMQADPDRFDIREARYGPTYELIFSRDYLARTGFRYQDFCYYFERTWDNSLALQRAYGDIRTIVSHWGIPVGDVHAGLYVEARREDGGLRIVDSRKGQVEHLDLGALDADILAATDQPVTQAAFMEALSARYAPEAIAAAVDRLDACDLLVRLDGRLLSLVLPAKPQSEGSYRTGVALPEAMAAEARAPEAVAADAKVGAGASEPV